MVKIALDAGHGIHTPGKRTPDDEREWRFNDKVLRSAKAELEAYKGVEILRVDDPTGERDVPLKERTNKANEWGADVYVSIHHNANTGKWGTWGGTETYVHESKPKDSVKLAEIVQPLLAEAYGLRNRGVNNANFHVLRETKMTAILTEGGFMDSKTDIKALRDDNKLARAGLAIAEGVAKYFDLKRSEPPKKPSESKVLYRVQTGAYRNVSNAKAELYRLQKKGYDTYTVKSGNLYRVQVGAYSEKDNARRQAERLKADGFATYITTDSGSPVDIGVKAPPKTSNKLSLPNGVLRRGARGDDVKALQEALNTVYFRVGKVDGIYGAKTFDAVRRFQSVYLPAQVDGIYGPNTKKAIERRLRVLGK